MNPSVSSLRIAALLAAALGLWAALPASAQVYRCAENGQTVYSDHPCGARSVAVPLLDNTPTAADQQAARERASAEAAQEREAQAARRKAQTEEDARQARIAEQAAAQAQLEAQRKAALAQDRIRYCHRVYVGPVPYPYPYPAPVPVVSPPAQIPTPMPRIVPSQQASGGKQPPFTQAPATPPTPIVPRPPQPHPPLYRIVCEPGYAYDGPEDLLPIQ